MHIHTDDWLAGILGHPVHVVTVDASAPADWLAPLAAHIASCRTTAMYCVKLETAAIAAVRAASTLGFYVVDVNVTLRIEDGDSVPVPAARPGVDVTECADVETGQAAVAIAASAMRFSRFHLDPGISADKAHRVKSAWIQSYVDGTRGETLWIARAAGRIVGFNAVLGTERNGAPVRTIDLIAVDPSSRRRGIGRALVADFISRYRGAGAVLQVGTQVANIPSLRLYEGMGFTVRQTTYVMHLHTHGGRPA